MASAWFVHALMKRPDHKILADQLLGATGAIVGGFAATALFHIPDSIDGLNVVVILFSCAGAVILVGLVDTLSTRRFTT